MNVLLKNTIMSHDNCLFNQVDFDPNLGFDKGREPIIFKPTKYLILLLFLLKLTAFAQTPIQSYSWKNVTINGGGYVPGFVYSKAAKNLLYARTDVGGAYRWDNANRKWIPLSDFVTSGNQLGVISIAADPTDSNRVYMATGLYTNSWDPNGVFYSSTDKGATWTRSELPCKVGGNEAGRGTGERLQVDPNLPNKLLFASQEQGLFQSLDYGKTWTKVSGFTKNNCTFLEVDPSSGTKGTASKDIYVGTYDHLASNDTTFGGLYRSIDAGANWSYWAGQFAKVEPKDFDKPKISTPAIPNNLAFTGDNIYITMGNNLAPGTSNGYVVKYNKTAKSWTKIYPFSKNTQGGYNSLSVHPTNPNIVVVGTLGYWWPTSDRIYITVDGGTTWTDVRTKMKTNNKNTPHGGGMGWNSGLKINPFNPKQAVFGSGNGLWMTENLDKAFTNDSTLWVYENDDFEETVPLALASPPSGAELISGLGDIKGFVHLDVTKSPADNYHHHGNTYSVDFAENDPKIIVRAHDGGKRASISRNNGVTWTDFAAQAIGGDTRTNFVSISPNGINIVWSPSDSFSSVSSNGGASWALCAGLGENVYPKSDRVNSNFFYAIDNATGAFFRSTDGAKTFTKTATTFSFTGGMNIVPVFGREGHVWLSAGANGLHYTTNGGTSFVKIATVDEAYRVTFGRAATGASYPSIFIYGKIDGIVGLFRSDDTGATWIKINTKNQEFGRGFTRGISGDPKKYGRLYIGTDGRGILYGDIQGTGLCYEANLDESLNICKQSYAALNSYIPDNTFAFTWFKDGVKQSSTVSSLMISATGTYKVVATKAGCPTTQDEIFVQSKLLNVQNIVICKGETATLSVDKPSTYVWQNASNVQIGNTSQNFSVTPASTSNYFVKDIFTTNVMMGMASSTSGGWGLGGSFDVGQNVATLTVIDDVRLKGISFRVNGAGTKGVIRILDDKGNVVTTSTRSNLAVGMQEIPFDTLLKAGTYKIDAVGTTGSVQFQTDRVGAVFSIPNYATYAPVSWGYGIFFNLKFEVGNTCAPTPVTVTVNPVPVVSITSPANNATLGTDIFPINTTVTGTNMSNVSFYNGSSLLGTDATSPYSFTTTSMVNGTYTFSAIAKNTFNCTDTAKVTVKINKVVTDLETSSDLSSNINSYPNPFQESMKIVTSGSFSYVFYNTAGSEVEKGNGNGSIIVGESLPEGLYILKVKSDMIEKTLKVSKSK
jgi:hypothetical protein